MHKRISPHGDMDHMGGAINLVNSLKVKKVIFNCGKYNNLEKELIKLLDKKKIKYYFCIKELNINKNKLYFLNTKELQLENMNQCDIISIGDFMNNAIMQLEHFFQVDTIIKKGMYNMAPSKIKYFET